MKLIIYIIFGSFVILYSCYYHDKTIVNKLQGSWIDAKPRIHNFANSNINLQFINDSFYYKISRYTDYNSKKLCDPERGTEFAKGKYFLDDERIYLQGYWMNADYVTIKDTGCYNNGLCMLSYYYRIKDDSFLYINPEKPVFEFDDLKDNLPLIRLKK